MSPLGQAAGVVFSDFYIYSALFSALAAGASATKNITIQADSEFVLQKLTHQSDIAAAAVTHSGRIVPLATILITDSGSGRQIMDTPIPIPCFFGFGALPFILPNPKIFKPNTNISIQVANYSAATTYNIYLAFIGTKRFI